jgi:hypothetical protein
LKASSFGEGEQLNNTSDTTKESNPDGTLPNGLHLTSGYDSGGKVKDSRDTTGSVFKKLSVLRPNATQSGATSTN